MAAHRHQFFTYALQPSLAAASTVSPAPPQPQPQPNTAVSSLYGSSAADRYYPDATFRFLARDGSESLTNYPGTVASSSAMYHHHLPNATASHLAYPQLIQQQQQQEAWPPGVEAPAVEPLPPGVKRTSEGLSFTNSQICICFICYLLLEKALKSSPFRFLCSLLDDSFNCCI